MMCKIISVGFGLLGSWKCSNSTGTILPTDVIWGVIQLASPARPALSLSSCLWWSSSTWQHQTPCLQWQWWVKFRFSTTALMAAVLSDEFKLLNCNQQGKGVDGNLMPALLFNSARSARIKDINSASEWSERDHRLYCFHSRLRFGPLCFAAGACPMPFNVFVGGCSCSSGEESSSSRATSSTSSVSVQAADGAWSDRDRLVIAASVV